MDEKFIKRFESFKNSLSSLSEVLRESFQADLITGDEWMDMLKVRNLLAHDYDGTIVTNCCQTIIHVYIDKLYDYQRTVENLLKL